MFFLQCISDMLNIFRLYRDSQFKDNEGNEEHTYETASELSGIGTREM